MTTLVEQLSRYATSVRYEDLPSEVVHQAKRLIIDTVGCGLGGYGSAPARIARDMAGTVRSSEGVSLIGGGERTSPDLATFANGAMIRFLDFNDGYTSTGESGHPGDSIAAVLTTAELRRRNGRDAIATTVLAYEVFCRVCDAVDLKPLGFDHATVGGMASTVAAARLLGLGEAQIVQAFNLGIAPNVSPVPDTHWQCFNVERVRLRQCKPQRGVCRHARGAGNDRPVAHFRRRGRVFQSRDS
jgi:2-methylcitrate dehydratase